MAAEQVSRRASVLWRSVPGYLVVSSIDGVVIEADGPGADIWDALAMPTTVDDIAALLATRYDAPLDVVRADVGAFVDRLAESGFMNPDD